MRPSIPSLFCTTLLAFALPAMAAPPGPNLEAMLDAWGIDTTVLVGESDALLRRAPDPAVDVLFQAVHASLQSPDEAAALCAMFDPAADRSLEAFNRVATGLSDTSRQRFANAVVLLLSSTAQGVEQPYDAEAARQSLKAAGVRTAMLNDGFTAGLNGNDPDARCHAVGQLVDNVSEQPQAERAAITRLMIGEGLAWLAPADAGER
jgi:hypothetical protein